MNEHDYNTILEMRQGGVGLDDVCDRLTSPLPQVLRVGEPKT
jgi:hypothetical protein